MQTSRSPRVTVETTEGSIQTCSHHQMVPVQISHHILLLQTILDGRRHACCNRWRVSGEKTPQIISRQRRDKRCSHSAGCLPPRACLQLNLLSSRFSFDRSTQFAQCRPVARSSCCEKQKPATSASMYLLVSVLVRFQCSSCLRTAVECRWKRVYRLCFRFSTRLRSVSILSPYHTCMFCHAHCHSSSRLGLVFSYSARR